MVPNVLAEVISLGVLIPNKSSISIYLLASSFFTSPDFLVTLVSSSFFLSFFFLISFTFGLSYFSSSLPLTISPSLLSSSSFLVAGVA